MQGGFIEHTNCSWAAWHKDNAEGEGGISMTDKFTEWLISQHAKYHSLAKKTHDMYDVGKETAYSYTLINYRKFLREQKPEKTKLVFWGGYYYRWDEALKRFIPQEPRK